jgi:hypothetical protein
MNITYEELRDIKHKLPTGSVRRIAQTLNIDEQTVRNYFGAQKYESGGTTGQHIQPGPHGGIVNLSNTSILELAKTLISKSNN